MSSSSDKELVEHDWYSVLDVTEDSSENAIQKAARKLSLLYHPDKSDAPESVRQFLLVQKAKDILLDSTKRKKYDDYIAGQRKRKEYEGARNNAMDSGRKRMKDELESKLRSYKDHPSNAKNDKEKIHVNLNTNSFSYHSKDDLNKFREDNQRMKEDLSSRSRSGTSTQTSNNSSDDNSNVVKVKWKRTHESHSDESLYQIFKRFGDIESVSLHGDKGTSALISFVHVSSASKAIREYESSNLFRVTEYGANKKSTPSIFTHQYSSHREGAFNSTKSGAFKDPTTEKSEIQRQIERERLLRELEREEMEGNAPFCSENRENLFNNDSVHDVDQWINSKFDVSMENFQKLENDILKKMLEFSSN